MNGRASDASDDRHSSFDFHRRRLQQIRHSFVGAVPPTDHPVTLLAERVLRLLPTTGHRPGLRFVEI